MIKLFAENRDNKDCFVTEWNNPDKNVCLNAYGKTFNLYKSYKTIVIGEMFYFREGNLTFCVVGKDTTDETNIKENNNE